MIAGQGRSRYLDGLPASELWGVSNGKALNQAALTRETGGKGIEESATTAKRARRRVKAIWRRAKTNLSLRAFLNMPAEINAF